MNALTGDGNGARIAELERRMRAKGFLAAASVVLAMLEFAVEAWFRT